MRVALVHYSSIRSNSLVRELLLRVPGAEVNSFYLNHDRLFTQEGNVITVHDIAIQNDVYVLDPRIAFEIRENLHHYFEMYAVAHIYGKTHAFTVAPHGFSTSKSLEIRDTENNIEQALVSLWTTIPHPVRIKRKGEISQEISSIHELRRHTLPHMVKGEKMECIYQPKGRKLTCTLLRNTRGKKVYTTPLFEKITHTFGDKLFSSSLSHNEKEKIIKKLEELFAHYPSMPTLHVELTHTPKGIYLMHAAPLHDISPDVIPATLQAVGMHPYEVLISCLTSLPAK